MFAVSKLGVLGFPEYAGLAVQRLLRLQAASGFGLRFYDLGVAVLARHQGLWFGGALGRWALLPSPWMVRADRHHESWLFVAQLERE